MAQLAGLLWINRSGFVAFEFVRNDWDQHGNNDFGLGNPAAFSDVGHSNCVPAQEDIII